MARRIPHTPPQFEQNINISSISEYLFNISWKVMKTFFCKLKFENVLLQEFALKLIEQFQQCILLHRSKMNPRLALRANRISEPFTKESSATCDLWSGCGQVGVGKGRPVLCCPHASSHGADAHSDARSCTFCLVFAWTPKQQPRPALGRNSDFFSETFY